MSVIDVNYAVMRKIWLAAIAVVVLLSACGSNKVKKPDTFLTEQQMIEVLSDSYLIEAELNQRKTMGENVTKLQEAYYSQFFEHYGIDDTILEQNMAYYTRYPEILERIMDSVNQRFVNALEGQ